MTATAEQFDAAIEGDTVAERFLATWERSPDTDVGSSAAWANEHGLSGDDATTHALARNPDVVAAINDALTDAMSTFDNAEAVEEVTILGDEWLPDSDLLTPTSKLKRRGILARFSDEIEAMYAK